MAAPPDELGKCLSKSIIDSVKKGNGDHPEEGLIIFYTIFLMNFAQSALHTQDETQIINFVAKIIEQITETDTLLQALHMWIDNTLQSLENCKQMPETISTNGKTLAKVFEIIMVQLKIHTDEK